MKEKTYREKERGIEKEREEINRERERERGDKQRERKRDKKRKRQREKNKYRIGEQCRNLYQPSLVLFFPSIRVL